MSGRAVAGGCGCGCVSGFRFGAEVNGEGEVYEVEDGRMKRGRDDIGATSRFDDAGVEEVCVEESTAWNGRGLLNEGVVLVLF